MVTTIFNDFDVETPKIHPINGDLLVTFVDTASDHSYVFPIPKDDADAWIAAMQRAVSAGKIITPSTSEVIRATGNR